jgi:hypothetical protein
MTMTGNGGGVQPYPMGEPPRSLVRWECRCQQPPVLLATYDASGRIHVKSRDRYWHILGSVQTVCPRCGSEHTLDLHGETEDGRRKTGEGGRKS